VSVPRLSTRMGRRQRLMIKVDSQPEVSSKDFKALDMWPFMNGSAN